MVKYTSVLIDDIVSELSGSFDYTFDGVSEFTPPKMPKIKEPFRIGLIVGASGSGKSTLLQDFGLEQSPRWCAEKAIVSHFESADDAVERLGAVGLNSIPSWMRPYHVLSTGEKFRADLARKLKSGAVVDEFTSVVDRSVAKSCSRALSRYVKSKGLQSIVIASCHRDIIDWLEPDWVFDTDTGVMSGRGFVRPEINIELLPCHREAWAAFSNHHYLDTNLNKSARCWLASWDGTPVGFTAVIAFPSKNWTNGWRGHRTVVLPDYQGLGIGNRLSDAVGEMVLSWGGRYFSKTSHPRMGGYRNASPKWRATSKNGMKRKDYGSGRASKESKYKHLHIDRVCFSHEYIGERIQTTEGTK